MYKNSPMKTYTHTYTGTHTHYEQKKLFQAVCISFQFPSVTLFLWGEIEWERPLFYPSLVDNVVPSGCEHTWAGEEPLPTACLLHRPGSCKGPLTTQAHTPSLRQRQTGPTNWPTLCLFMRTKV